MGPRREIRTDRRKRNAPPKVEGLVLNCARVASVEMFAERLRLKPEPLPACNVIQRLKPLLAGGSLDVGRPFGKSEPRPLFQPLDDKIGRSNFPWAAQKASIVLR